MLNQTILILKKTMQKITNVNGEEKRVIQLSLNMGLKSNEYPTKEIKTEITLPEINGEKPTVVAKSNFNTMTNFGYNYDGNSKIELNFTNEPNSENKILWKKHLFIIKMQKQKIQKLH